MIEKFANENTYTVQERKDKKTKEKQPAHNNQDIIINFFSQGNT